MSAAQSLKCDICPRKPNFSDVSHLLTHVSSKGHLSHYFKLQVRSHQEPGASQLLATYDQWYNDNNLANLLSERMIAKEAKKGKDPSSTVAALQLNSSRRNSSAQGSNDDSLHSSKQDQLPSFLDPRLSYPFRFDVEHETPDCYDSSNHNEPVNGNSLHTSGPDSYPWQPIPENGASFHPGLPMSNTWKIEPQSESDVEASPLVQRKKRMIEQTKPRANPPPRRARRAISPDPFVDDASFEYEDDDESELRAGEEMTKLKGVLWPGMDIFDSATEKMRRKRNQKKDGTILKQMEKTSENVEATELVFSPGGTLRKERPISGMVEDSSPLKGETPIPKRRVPRPRRATLSQVDPNTNLSMAQSRYKLKLRKQSQAIKLEQLSRQALPLLGNSPPRRLPTSFGTRFDGVDDDFKMAFSGFNPNNRRGFSVFHDGKKDGGVSRGPLPGNNGHHQKPLYGSFSTAGALGQTNTLKCWENRQRFAPKAYSANRTMSMPEASRGKENIEPILTQMGRVDPQGGNNRWDGQQNIAPESRYASQYFYGFHGSYGSFAENDAFGYSCNPLALSGPQNPQTARPKDCIETSEVFGRPGHEVTDNTRPFSPDGTVSDLGPDDITNMYLDELHG